MNEYKVPTPPLGMYFNSDKKVVDLVIQSLATRTFGFCPCIPKHLHVGEDNLCPCKDARTHKECLCKLFVKV